MKNQNKIKMESIDQKLAFELKIGMEAADLKGRLKEILVSNNEFGTYSGPREFLDAYRMINKYLCQIKNQAEF